MKLHCLIRISLDEILDYYLERDDLLTAQKLILRYDLKSTKILEYKLESCAYRDADVVKEFLDISFEELQNGKTDHQELFMKLTHMILKQKVESYDSLKILLDHCRKLLIAKMKLESEETSQELILMDKAYLRQILSYQRRLSLFSSLVDLQQHSDSISWPDLIPSDISLPSCLA